MKLSTKAQHAVTAMINLAMNNGIRPVTLAEISKNQGISLSYLEQLFSKMRKAGLVEGVRGPGGGYKLAKSPKETCIAEIVIAIDGGTKAHATAYAQSGQTQHDDAAYRAQLHQIHVTHHMWKILSDKIYDFLCQLTLAEFSDTSILNKLTSNDEPNDDLEHIKYKGLSATSF